MSQAAEPGPVARSITAKLREALSPSHLEVRNESYMHSVPAGSETHFKVVVVSDQFEGLGLLKRHRWVNRVLAEELGAGVHALSIVAKTPEAWEKVVSGGGVKPSPSCRGGFGK